MKNRVKLSFSQLQAEMSEEKQLITEEKELAQLSGGLSIDEFVALMQGWGFDFRNDASGNYYYESLPDVVVSSSYEQVYGMSYDQWYNQYGYLTNLSNPYHGTDPSWQGYPNTYPGTGGGGGGTTGTGTNNPSVPTNIPNFYMNPNPIAQGGDATSVYDVVSIMNMALGQAANHADVSMSVVNLQNTLAGIDITSINRIFGVYDASSNAIEFVSDPNWEDFAQTGIAIALVFSNPATAIIGGTLLAAWELYEYVQENK